MIEFSVVVLLYNSERKMLLRTLDSILCQREVSYELILADDGSENACLEIAQKYLEQKGYITYTVITHKKNVGTVQNIHDAMKKVKGKYVKCIGAGDYLMEDITLKKVFDFMEETSAAMCFGKMQAYCEEDGKPVLADIFCPSDIVAFEKDNTKKIKKNIVQNHGWIVGASMFYHGEKFKKYLEEIVGTVIYCEDLLQVILLVEGERVCYLQEGLLYYEVESGISTSGTSGNSARMQKDQDLFWNMIIKKYPENVIVHKGFRMYQCQAVQEQRKRQLQIILHNPDYVWMLFRTIFQKKKYRVKEQGILQKLYREHQEENH
jgi:glycosyltransferase involved in cell wall biosynthesis